MSEVWEWDAYYGVHFCCLGAVLREEYNVWYFFPYRSYKHSSHKHSFGPYKSQKKAEQGLYDWHKRVADFVGVLGELDGVDI